MMNAVKQNYGDGKLVCYKTLPIWNVKTLPKSFKECHNTKEGVWAKLKILSGSLVMEFLNDKKEIEKETEYSVVHQPEMIKPRQYHKIASCSEDMTCQLSFYTVLSND